MRRRVFRHFFIGAGGVSFTRTSVLARLQTGTRTPMYARQHRVELWWAREHKLFDKRVSERDRFQRVGGVWGFGPTLVGSQLCLKARVQLTALGAWGGGWAMRGAWVDSLCAPTPRWWPGPAPALEAGL